MKLEEHEKYAQILIWNIQTTQYMHKFFQEGTIAVMPSNTGSVYMEFFKRLTSLSSAKAILFLNSDIKETKLHKLECCQQAVSVKS